MGKTYKDMHKSDVRGKHMMDRPVKLKRTSKDDPADPWDGYNSQAWDDL